jgi:hypothetical protein
MLFAFSHVTRRLTSSTSFRRRYPNRGLSGSAARRGVIGARAPVADIARLATLPPYNVGAKRIAANSMSAGGTLPPIGSRPSARATRRERNLPWRSSAAKSSGDGAGRAERSR